MRISAIFLVPCLLAVGPLTAATRVVCVASTADFTNALATLAAAPGNNDSDDIRIRAGTYIAPAGGWVGTASGSHDLTIRGGYTDVGCSQQTKDASFTILDGGNTSGVLTINAAFSHVAVIEVSGLTFQNGNSTAAFGSVSGGLKISDPGPISNGSILIERNIFHNNVGASPNVTSSSGGLLVATDGPSLIVRNNLFINNSAPKIAAVFLFSNNTINVSNNTFSENHATDTTQTQRFAMDFFSLTGLTLSNNIFWGNSVGPGIFDLNLSGQVRGATLINNDIEATTGTAVAATGTVAVDPLFIGGANFRLSAASALINTGVNNPGGGLADVDLDGMPRLSDGVVDLGAYESSGIFTNGFEQP